jgi:CHAD domain-containing protein
MVSARKAGRTRSQPWRIVWHDTADLRLARDDLALSEQRSVWRLEPLLPSADPRAAAWPPGAPPPVLAEAGDAAALTESLPVRAVASCEGSLRSLVLQADESTVSVAVLDAVLRTVTRHVPVGRVWLDGEDAACAALALALAEQIGLAVPTASLAGEALAAVMADTAKPRRFGAPALPPEAEPAEAFAHIVGHLADVILYWAPRAVARDGTEPVHQMRVALRRLRAGLSVFRRAVGGPSFDAVAGEARHLAALLGPARDWDVFCAETGAAVLAAFGDDKAVARLIAAAERRRKDAYAELTAFLGGAAFRGFGIRLAVLAGGTAWQAELTAEQQEMLSADMAAFAGRVLNRRLKRVLEAGDEIGMLDAPSLHRVRLDGKRLRYAAEMFAPLFDRKETRRFLRRLTDLQETLGTLNDGAVATTLMAELAGPRPGAERAFAAGVVRGFVAAKGGAARKEIVQAWEKFRRVEPFW